MIHDIFKHTRINAAKLKAYGFTETDDGFLFGTGIFDGQFDMLVNITKNGGISAKVIDAASNEEYRLHLIEGSAGEFVGRVRTEFESVLCDVRDKCFDKEIFKSGQAKQVIEYVRRKYGDELEFLWKNYPTAAIWRRKDNAKWYGLITDIQKRKLGINSGEPVEIIDLRIEPSEIESVIDGERYFRGYHMNKKSWFTICLDSGVPTETVFRRIDQSYALALKK